MIGSIRLDGSTACMTLDGATDTEVFRAYVQSILCPTLRPGDVVSTGDPPAPPIHTSRVQQATGLSYPERMKSSG